MASSARISVEVQTDRLIALGTSSAGPLYRRMVSLDAQVETAAKRNASGPIVKVRTGNLRSSIHSAIEVRGTVLVGQVIADASYALAVHEGSKAHDIEAKSAKALRWTAPGGSKKNPNIRFAKRVHIPEQRGRPFLTDALVQVIH